jgi:hypothetical protein
MLDHRDNEMLKPWHKEDAFGALRARGWTGPEPLAYPEDWHYVGEAWYFSRANWTFNLYFVADYGTGFAGAETVESIAGRLVGDSGEHDLWLRRTRDAKWKASVIEWADAISADRSVKQAPAFKLVD